MLPRPLIALAAALLVLAAPAARAAAPAAPQAENASAETGNGPETLFGDGDAEAAEPGPRNPFRDELAKALELARARLRTPDAALPLLRAFSLRDRLQSLHELARLYGGFAESRAVPPDVRALARHLHGQIERSRGRLPRAEQSFARLGFIGPLRVIGPFDNEGKSGCNTVYPPERELDLEGRYPGKVRETAWRTLPALPMDGYVDLSAAMTPSDETVTYALAILEAPADEKVVLHLGASGATRLFVNGTRVLADDAYHAPRLDQAHVAVTLRKGSNRVLLKLCQATGPHGFYLRLTNPEGDPLPKIAVTTPDPVPAAPRGAVAASRLPTLLEHFKRRAEAPGADAEARAEYAEMLLYRQEFDSRERRDAVEAARAARMAPGSAAIQLLAAQTADDSNERRRYLEAALAIRPTPPAAALALARHRLSQEYPRRAMEVIEPALKDSPGYFPLAVLQARALEDLGLGVQAAALLESLASRFPDEPEIAREAARLARRRDRLADATALYRVAIALRFDDRDSRRALATILSERGDVDGALKELRELNRLDPWSVDAWLRTAEIAAANGRPDEARAAFTRARELAPEDAEVHEREGRALARLGDTGPAIAALARSLDLKPQNPQVKEALKALRSEGRGFGEDLTYDLRKLAEAKPIDGEDAVVLAELSAVKVLPSGLSQRFEQLVVRVQTPRGVEKERSQWVTYAPDRQDLTILRARILRPDGSILETHNETERSLSDNSTKLYYDARARLVSFPNLAPGDVFELTWRLDDTANDNLLSDYFGDMQSVQGDSFKQRFDYYLLAPAGRTIYASTPPFNLEKTEKAQPDGSVLHHWTASDVPRVTPEPGMPARGELSPPLHVSTYKDWDAVGRFYWGLVRDQLTPTDELRQVVDELKRKVPPRDEMAMIRAVYDFVVSRTRYVGLEFGIHGYKPYKVDKVLARRFGDCKDKASLMHALLKVAGIDSRLVLLRMRRLGRLPPGPASLAGFDHAILYVPGHDLYLDGTAEQHGSRELPMQDRDATVLVIQPNGGTKLGQTPEGRAVDNKLQSEFEVALTAAGTATIRGRTTITGLFAPEYRRTYQAAATRRQEFEESWARTFPGLAVRELAFNDLNDIEKDVQVTYAMDVPRYANLDDGALSFSPFGQGQSFVETYAPLSTRKHDLVMGYPWTNRGKYRVKLPAGFAPNALPENVEVKSAFGLVRLNYRIDGDSLELESEVAFETPRIAAADYPAFRAFLGRVDQALATRIKLAPALKLPKETSAPAN